MPLKGNNRREVISYFIDDFIFMIIVMLLVWQRLLEAYYWVATFNFLDQRGQRGRERWVRCYQESE